MKEYAFYPKDSSKDFNIILLINRMLHGFLASTI